MKCWKHTGHGEVADASSALQFSCNDYLCETAYRLGSRHGMEYTDRVSLAYLQKYARLFHLDKKSGIEITESEPHVMEFLLQSARARTTMRLSSWQGMPVRLLLAGIFFRFPWYKG